MVGGQNVWRPLGKLTGRTSHDITVQSGTDESAIKMAKRKIKMPRVKKLRRVEFLARMASKIKNVATMNKPQNRHATIQRTKLRIAVLNCRGINEVKKDARSNNGLTRNA